MRLKLHQSGPWIGVSGALVVLFIGFPAMFFYAPPWGIALILGLAVAQIVIVLAMAKSRPVWSTYVPIFGLLAYFALLYAGLKWWGWGE